jgi:hypothetical protein
MNRRGFLSTLAGAAAALTLDPEKLLWVPGKKTISIPSAVPAELADMFEMSEKYSGLGPEWKAYDAALLRNMREGKLVEILFRDNPLVAKLASKKDFLIDGGTYFAEEISYLR